jgi:hypothetical protein
MEAKEIELLKKQIEKLERKDFDLEAWKNFTVVILGRIFGEDSHKINQIEGIEYEHSSWSLRDTSGVSAIQACKDLGKEILEASIVELESFGIPALDHEDPDEIIKIISEALHDELKGAQFRELKTILLSRETAVEKQMKVAEKLLSYGTDAAILVLSRILANARVGKKLK